MQNLASQTEELRKQNQMLNHQIAKQQSQGEAEEVKLLRKEIEELKKGEQKSQFMVRYLLDFTKVLKKAQAVVTILEKQPGVSSKDLGPMKKELEELRKGEQKAQFLMKNLVNFTQILQKAKEIVNAMEKLPLTQQRELEELRKGQQEAQFLRQNLARMFGTL